MTKDVSRREFLAATLAAPALAAYGRDRLRLHHAQARQPALVQASPEPKLWLPASGGRGANVKFANSPDWLRDTPGWYIPSTVSAGACMLDFPLITFLSSLIKHFRELPSLLDQARSLGTSTIYLVDWFEGKPGAHPGQYWTNKGDYIPRTDMGGDAALKDGISALHAKGGRVILYVEGFIIIKDTSVGQTHGAQWSIIGPKGPLQQPYPGAWKPCPGAEGWLAYVENLARRIGGYGADGIFFDSQGFQHGFKCRSRAHGHPPGDPNVFDNGCANLLRRARAALRESSPEAIVLTEGPTMERLFQYTDGSLEWGIDTFVRRWLWDDQGKTDTMTSSYSLDDWNQIVAIGAKLAFGSQFSLTPPGSSAQGFLGEFLTNDSFGAHDPASAAPEKLVELQHVAQHAFWGLHAWRNAGLILGLTMPGLDDILPRYWEMMEHVPDPYKRLYSSSETLRGVLEGLRPRAAAIDNTLAGKKAPAPAEYVKALLTARQKLAPFVDHGGSVELVRMAFPEAAGWRFTSNKGMALTAVNVSDAPRIVSFPNTTGTWSDGVSGDVLAAQNHTLAVPVPAHRVRLLSAGTR